MNKKVITILKLAVTVVIILLFIWFVFIWPTYTFKKNEKALTDAAKRYYELNQTELPTGTRIATVDMQTLYHKAYLKEDFYIPYTDEPCSLKESWVKVKKETNGEYKYYTYLKCGALQSTIDNKGPEIQLKGNSEITVDLGSKYVEPGVKSVIDNADGKIDVSKVTIKSGDVNTNKIGTYEVTYTAFDSLKNKTTITRTVKVISKIKNAVSTATENKGYYIGVNPNNYISLSGMLFRIVGIDGDNVKIIADQDIANVNYSAIDSWLDYYMKHINDEAKKLLVKNKYCTDAIAQENIDTIECTKYTKEKYAHIISLTDINKSIDETGSYLKPGTMSWTANESATDMAYVTKNQFFGEFYGHKYMIQDKNLNYGVRPILTIKGDTLVISGNGTSEKPYSFGETKVGQKDDYINTRYSGEYIQYAGMIWRIIEVNEDGTTKVVSNSNITQDLQPVLTKYSTTATSKIYNPTEKGNVGYYINNKVSEFIDTSYFVNKNVTVPTYSKDIKYGEEVSKKKYKVKLSAPNMYEMFSATPNGKTTSYWLINSSKEPYYKGVISDIGVVINGTIADYTKFGIRVVGNLKKSTSIVKGQGTLENPYTITK